MGNRVRGAARLGISVVMLRVGGGGGGGEGV